MRVWGWAGKASRARAAPEPEPSRGSPLLGFARLCSPFAGEIFFGGGRSAGKVPRRAKVVRSVSLGLRRAAKIPPHCQAGCLAPRGEPSTLVNGRVDQNGKDKEMKSLVAADAWKGGGMAVNSDVAAAGLRHSRSPQIWATRPHVIFYMAKGGTRPVAVPPFIGIYRLLPPFIASHQEIFFCRGKEPEGEMTKR
jgi:hypothetical protein